MSHGAFSFRRYYDASKLVLTSGDKARAAALYEYRGPPPAAGVAPPATPSSSAPPPRSLPRPSAAPVASAEQLAHAHRYTTSAKAYGSWYGGKQ